MTDLSKYRAAQCSQKQKEAILFTPCYLLQHGICSSVNQSPTPSRWPASPGQRQVVWFDSAIVTHLPNAVFPNWSNNQTSVQSVSHKVLLLIISSFLYHLAVNHCYQFAEIEAVVFCLQIVTPVFCLYAQSTQASQGILLTQLQRLCFAKLCKHKFPEKKSKSTLWQGKICFKQIE